MQTPDYLELGPYPGEDWRWPLDCPVCDALVGPWNPAVAWSAMTHIRPDGGIDWAANKDHDVPSIPVDAVSRETTDCDRGFFPRGHLGTPRPVPQSLSPDAQ